MEHFVDGFLFALGALLCLGLLRFLLSLVAYAMAALNRKIDPLGSAIQEYSDALTRDDKK